MRECSKSETAEVYRFGVDMTRDVFGDGNEPFVWLEHTSSLTDAIKIHTSSCVLGVGSQSIPIRDICLGNGSEPATPPEERNRATDAS